MKVCEAGMCWAEPLCEAFDDESLRRVRAEEENERLREEVVRLQETLVAVVDQVESCCSRAGLCIDVAAARRRLDA